MVTYPLPKVKYQKQKQVALLDLTGGLDLRRPGFEVESKSTDDATNVDFLAGGGFGLRPSVEPFNSNDLTARITTLSYVEAPTPMVVAGLDNGSAWVLPSAGQPAYQLIAATTGSKWRAVAVNGKVYCHDGLAAARLLSGTTTTAVGTDWNTAGPTTYENKGMPVARYMATFNARMWAASTLEAGTRYENRVRYSVPLVNLTGEKDWRQADYFDVSIGGNAETIQGIVPVGSFLFVLKQHSVHAITGWDVTDITVAPVELTIGAAGPQAFCASEGVLWLWDADTGMNVISGADTQDGFKSVRMSRQLDKLIEDRRVVDPAATTVVAHPGKILLTLTLDTGRTTFAYDTTVNCWARYSLALGAGVRYAPSTGNAATVVANLAPHNASRALTFGGQQHYDDYGNGSQDITAYVRTPWLHDTAPSVEKHWRTVELIMDTESTAQTTITVSGDFDPGRVLGSVAIAGAPADQDPFTLAETGGAGSTMVDTIYERKRPGAERTPRPGRQLTGGDVLTGAAGETILRTGKMPRLATRAVQLRIQSPTPGARWIVRAAFLTYLPSAKVC